MNFSKHNNHLHTNKGSFVWKRNVKTSDNIGRISKNEKINKKRLISQSEEFSAFLDTQHSQMGINVIKNNKQEWNEIKAIAKRTNIASRMELKKQTQMTMNSTDKKTNTNYYNKSNSRCSFQNSIGQNDKNHSKSFCNKKQQKLNPHLLKDVNIMRQRVVDFYEKQKEKMDNFLQKNHEVTISQTESKPSDLINLNQFLMKKKNPPQKDRSKSLLVSDTISKPQNIQLKNQYETVYSSRRQPLKNGQSAGIQLDKSDRKYGKGQGNKIMATISGHPKNSSILTANSTKQSNKLVGLMGQYQKYEKYSKKQLIEKLISLQYLAQNIFHKNKYLEEQLMKNKMNNFMNLYHKPEIAEVQEFREKLSESEFNN